MKFLTLLLALFLSSCQGSDVKIGPLIQEFFGMLIIAGFAYSGGILILGLLTDISWLKRQAEERGKKLAVVAVVCLVLIIFDEYVQQAIQKAINIFGIK
ncbi:MAG: hypothetical protein ACOH5I_26365 [Oligoflexus sp.]